MTFEICPRDGLQPLRKELAPAMDASTLDVFEKKSWLQFFCGAYACHPPMEMVEYLQLMRKDAGVVKDD